MPVIRTVTETAQRRCAIRQLCVLSRIVELNGEQAVIFAISSMCALIALPGWDEYRAATIVERFATRGRSHHDRRNLNGGVHFHRLHRYRVCHCRAPQSISSRWLVSRDDGWDFHRVGNNGGRIMILPTKVDTKTPEGRLIESLIGDDIDAIAALAAEYSDDSCADGDEEWTIVMTPYRFAGGGWAVRWYKDLHTGTDAGTPDYRALAYCIDVYVWPDDTPFPDLRQWFDMEVDTFECEYGRPRQERLQRENMADTKADGERDA